MPIDEDDLRILSHQINLKLVGGIDKFPYRTTKDLAEFSVDLVLDTEQEIRSLEQTPQGFLVRPEKEKD